MNNDEIFDTLSKFTDSLKVKNVLDNFINELKFNPNHVPSGPDGGQFTSGDGEAVAAIQSLKTHIDSLTELQNKLQALAHQIQYGENNGGITGDVSELVDQWSKVKGAGQRLTELHNSINTAQETINSGVNDWVDEDILKRVTERQVRDIAKVPKEIKSAVRIEKAATQVFDRLKR